MSTSDGRTEAFRQTESRSAQLYERAKKVLPGGNTVLEHHLHDHGVLILHGRARVRLGDTSFEVGPNDLVYISPNDTHQFHTLSDEPLGFLCVIPNKEKLTAPKA